MFSCRILFILAVCGMGSFSTGAEQKPISYDRDIRPILSENCFYCHGQDANKRKADLQLNTLEGLQSIVVKGKPAESEMVKRIHGKDDAELMPPPKSNRKLSAEQKKLLERWIAEGAPFENHWAYEAPVRPKLPQVPDAKHPIDAFIRAKLHERTLSPAPEADRMTLIRRVSFDLTGLPPTEKEVQDFVNDATPNAYEKLIDRLMQSPRYGERMALPWLDAARYADSNGFQQDGDTFQWVWRDWVVNALNKNMPFDQFTIEQLAGDLLPNATRDQKIASAFNRNHLVNGEGGAIPEEQRFVILFDRVDVTATNWLGLTMACSQCHDHKYDPITMKDYYCLQAAFNNVSERGNAGRQSSKTRVSPPFIEAPSPAQVAQVAALEKVISASKSLLAEKQKLWELRVAEDVNYPDKALRAIVLNSDPKAQAKRATDLKKNFEEKIEATLVASLKAAEKDLAEYRADTIPKVMVMADDQPRQTHILDRGEYLKPLDKVSFNTPAFLPPLPKDAPKNRLGLAQWLMMKENPLTARVAVNRMWQTLFGVGLVRTSEDFGVQSEPPEHRLLLDWLAVEFRESGWDMKKLNRLILTSATYKQSSKVTAEAQQQDPENRLYARGARYRLPAMFLRDAVLAQSGLLDDRVGGKPVYPYQPEGIWDSLAITKERDFTYPKSKGADLYRRSIYTFWRRTVGPANMFDASSRQACKVRTSVTNTPLHALTTLNDTTWTEAARVLAEKAIQAQPDSDKRIDFIFRRILVREPRETEKKVLKVMLNDQLELYRKDIAGATKSVSVGESPRDAKLNPAEHAAWSALCLALLNLDETLTRE